VGTVGGNTPIRAGWGLFDLLRAPEKHDVLGFGPWRERAVCRCGVVAFADHDAGAWRGPEGHELAFGAYGGQFTLHAAPEAPVEPVEEPELYALPTRREPPSHRARMVAKALGIDLPDDTVAPGNPVPDPMDQPE